MGMLHQLLAVEGDLVRAAKARIAESEKTFKKSDRFLERITSLKHMDQAMSHLDETTVKSMDTTVPEVLGYTFIALEQSWDATIQKESTNQVAGADIVVDGEIIAEKVPATALLALESRLTELKQLVLQIPTLAPGRRWELTDLAEDVYVDVNPESRFKTEKKEIPIVMYEATDKHPAQVTMGKKDEIVGKYVDNISSGMMSPLHKAEFLDRLEEMSRAVKKARQEANSVPVVSRNIAKSILKYIGGEDLTKKSPTAV